MVGAAMHLVGSGLDGQVQGTSGITARLGIGLGLRGEFINGIDRHHHTGDSRYATLIDRGNVVPEVVVIGSVNLPVHLVGACSVERAEPAHRVAAVTWLDGHELPEIASA